MLRKYCFAICLLFVSASQCVNGPCGPGNDQCGAPFGQNSPQYHIRDLSCGENDPNFPLYDPLNKLYHHFYQDHLAEGNGQGPIIGHTVSADMVHWAHLPVAVWNDQPYDNVAIYTGSATIVNGVPTMVYPGLCNKADWPACETGTLFAIALPADHAGDPLLTNWTKPAYNPIQENTQRDPSTAWQTATGEWRMTNYEGKVYTSTDFVSWFVANNSAALFPTAECPSFFPLPARCTGNGCDATPAGVQPNYVHKQSSGGQDWYTFGVYADSSPNSTGTWVPSVGVPLLQPLDATATNGKTIFYASKDFFDPVGAGRRIYYGWALVGPASTQTLARVTNYHPALNILTFNPLPELASLRESPPLFTAASVDVPAGGSVWLGDWQDSAGNQSEFGASFAFPTSAATFGVNVMVGSGSGSVNVSTGIVLSFDPVSFTLNVSVGPSAPPFNYSYYMPGIDLPGGDYNVTNVNYSDPHICQAVCTADPNCKAYTYVTRPPLVGSCCLKSSVPLPNPYSACTSGSKTDPWNPTTSGIPLPLLPGDADVDVRVFVDNTFVEVFVMQGRLAFTVPITSGGGAAGMTLFAQAPGAGVVASSVNVWHMGSIWVSPPEVLAQRERAATA